MSAPVLDTCFALTAGRGQRSFSVKVNFKLESGVLALFGPSGVGKTLTLRALAGLERPASGHIAFNGNTVFDSRQKLWVPAWRRRVGWMPQHNALFPFKSVRANVAFGLPAGEREGPRVAELLEELTIEHLAQASPGSLSGGERKRVALARALAVEPEILLLDEPFASIDRDGRDELLALLQGTLARRSVPAVIVTHDAHEAQRLANSVVLYERGSSAEQGDPKSMLRGY
ncbi:MAG TPA: ATP-binding cassette domain-containing protein [Deltaproteobacteria bacterium]|nr:ATP-binding cassette domain-containing protein [Candidatus Binatota bacterium]HIL14281.1 ATP-binding cassette domain-containing protein [Deltaproteobacteria bacterium]